MLPRKISMLLKLFTQKTHKSGCIEVTGQSHAEIMLGKRKPKKLRVHFIDDPKNVPCNCHFDRFIIDVVKTDGVYYLVIFWHVSDMRVIEWSCLA
jgi:hypothetical protein